MGAIFSNIQVVRFNEDKTEDHRQKVPVTFSNKEKYIRRIFEDPDLLGKSAIAALPMIGYELSNIIYAPERKLSRFNKIILENRQSDTGSVKSVMMPIPYDFVYNATIIAKNQEDLFQIMEQIIPFFSPDLVFTMRGLQNPNLEFDVPITLQSVQISDSYDGSLDERRVLTCELSFLLKGFLFGPVRDGKVIKKIDLEFTRVLPPYIIKEIEITPFIDGVPVEDIGPNDNYGFTINSEEFL